MAELVLDRVTKRFDNVTAVDDLSLEVADGEFLVLLGPSGCGKSTALRMIAGLEEPTEGTIRIGDRVVNGVEPRDRDVAMVFQSYALYPHKTVHANIEFPLLPRKVAKEDRERQVREAAGQLGLGELLDRKPGQLSGGQRQRVALARAIVRRPVAFLMDEPLSNLDAKLRLQTRAELVELQRRLDTTVVYVTHDQVEAMTMADRVVVLSDGVLQQVDAPQEVYDRPANLFVARFIGNPAMNTMPVTLEGDRARVAGGELRLPGSLARAAGERAVLGVRPEDLRITPDGGVEAKLRVIESLGHERLLVCELGDGTSLIVRTSSDGTAPDEGAPVRLDAAPGSLHLFDPDTTDRLG